DCSGNSARCAVDFTINCQGCPAGFWKQPQHFQFYGCGLTPTTLVNSVFNGACTGAEYATATLLQGLIAFPGNRKTVQGAKEILIREGIAAVLNACALQGYPLTVQQVISEVNAALCSNFRATILAEANRLSVFNNYGCPLPK